MDEDDEAPLRTPRTDPKQTPSGVSRSLTVVLGLCALVAFTIGVRREAPQGSVVGTATLSPLTRHTRMPLGPLMLDAEVVDHLAQVALLASAEDVVGPRCALLVPPGGLTLELISYTNLWQLRDPSGGLTNQLCRFERTTLRPTDARPRASLPLALWSLLFGALGAIALLSIAHLLRRHHQRLLLTHIDAPPSRPVEVHGDYRTASRPEPTLPDESALRIESRRIRGFEGAALVIIIVAILSALALALGR